MNNEFLGYEWRDSSMIFTRDTVTSKNQVIKTSSSWLDIYLFISYTNYFIIV